ncbi:hypothetical protein DF182_30265 [Chitinophaga flava]|uniref:Uncharacterized protein n=1 Tax=Chitinophaga flava TaxID=2259036 RepID=A0A365XWI2_9BACT|nr:hypothetical protein DF182_30265 [Chitinophaga flava]
MRMQLLQRTGHASYFGHPSLPYASGTGNFPCFTGDTPSFIVQHHLAATPVVILFLQVFLL